MESSDINLNLYEIYIVNYYLRCNSYDENSDLIKYRLNFEDIGEIPSEYKIDIPQFIEKVRINFFNFFIFLFSLIYLY